MILVTYKLPVKYTLHTIFRAKNTIIDVRKLS